MSAAAESRATVVVRDAVDDDLPAITEIYRHHVMTGLASFEEVPPNVDVMAGRRRDILACGLPYLAAEIDGALSGFAYAGRYRTRTAYRYTVEDSIYVAPRAARRGVGHALLDGLIVICTELGYRQMVAVIGDSGNTASVRLHRRLGFEVIGTLPATGYKFGRWVDSVMMQRRLGDGQDTLPPSRAHRGKEKGPCT